MVEYDETIEAHFLDGPLKGEVRVLNRYSARQVVVPMTSYLDPNQSFVSAQHYTFFEGIYDIWEEYRDAPRRVTVAHYRFSGIRHKCPKPPIPKAPQPVKVTIEGDAEVKLTRKL